MPRERKPTNRFTFHEKGGPNPTTPPVDTTTKKKPRYHYEEIKDDGSSDSYATGGFLPILRPTAVVAAPTSPVAVPTGGTSPVASGSGWGGLPPPPPPMGAVGGAATGAVAFRTVPLLARTTAVNAETQTDPMVFPFVFPGGGWTLYTLFL